MSRKHILSPEQCVEILKSWKKPEVLAAEYGVSAPTIYKIRAGKALSGPITSEGWLEYCLAFRRKRIVEVEDEAKRKIAELEAKIENIRRAADEEIAGHMEILEKLENFDYDWPAIEAAMNCS